MNVPSKQKEMQRIPIIEDFIAIHDRHAIGQRNADADVNNAYMEPRHYG
jgi:hypothetical protein